MDTTICLAQKANPFKHDLNLTAKLINYFNTSD